MSGIDFSIGCEGDRPPPPLLARPLKTRPTSWDPSNAKVALNVSLDACFVPTSAAAVGDGGGGLPGQPAGCRVALSHVVALDGVVDEDMRRGLFERITARGWDEASPSPPSERWERRTADLYHEGGETNGGDVVWHGDWDGTPAPAPPPTPTWGLTEAALRDLDDDAAVSDWAFLEVHARLCKLYPNWTISHMPVDSLRQRRRGGVAEPKLRADGGDGDGDVDAGGDGVAGGDGGQRQARRERERERDRERHHCDVFVANAAVHGDGFRWHVVRKYCAPVHKTQRKRTIYICFRSSFRLSSLSLA